MAIRKKTLTHFLPSITQDWPFQEIFARLMAFWGFLGGSVVKDLAANAGDLGLIPGLATVHGVKKRRTRQSNFTSLHFLEEEMASTQVFLSRKSHGQRSLVGYSPWSLKRVRCDLAAKQQQQTNGTGC